MTASHLFFIIILILTLATLIILHSHVSLNLTDYKSRITAQAAAGGGGLVGSLRGFVMEGEGGSAGLWGQPAADSDKEREEGGGGSKGKDAPHNLSNMKPHRSGKKSSATLLCPTMTSPSDVKNQADMVYWEDLPNDHRPSNIVSPNKYVTFEPDHGGWNNIRMSMETMLAFAVATGRTLVIPPKKTMYLLGNDKDNKENNQLDFSDFFDLEAMAAETEGFNVMEMKDFLELEGGKLLPFGEDGPVGDTPTKLPGGITDWSEVFRKKPLEEYLRTVGLHRKFDTVRSMIIIPSDLSKSSPSDLSYLTDTLSTPSDWGKESQKYFSSPTSTRSSASDRFAEFRAGRSSYHVYDQTIHSAKLIHFAAGDGYRMLTHFYTMLFFEDPLMDRWTKRFVRDHVRYRDEMYCVAAKVVGRVREISRNNGDEGEYDSMHIRRGDFQYKTTRVDADVLYSNTKSHLKEGGTIYVATDERDKSFFNPLREKGNYNLVFLDDFMSDEDVANLNPNFYGMLDQLIATRGRNFYGTFFSTFTGYINRMRGYHDDLFDERNGQSNDGAIDSWYFAPKDKEEEMSKYMPIRPPFYSREYPVAWRDIDE